MKQFFPMWLSFWLLVMFAQALAQVELSQDKVLQMLAACNSEIELSADLISSKAISEELRKAVVHRGVVVHLLLNRRYLMNGNNYAWGLSIMRQAQGYEQLSKRLQIRVLDSREELPHILLLDKAELVMGKQIAVAVRPGIKNPQYSSDGAALAQAKKWFGFWWDKAKPWSNALQEPKFKVR